MRIRSDLGRSCASKSLGMHCKRWNLSSLFAWVVWTILCCLSIFTELVLLFLYDRSKSLYNGDFGNVSSASQKKRKQKDLGLDFHACGPGLHKLLPIAKDMELSLNMGPKWISMYNHGPYDGMRRNNVQQPLTSLNSQISPCHRAPSLSESRNPGKARQHSSSRRARHGVGRATGGGSNE